MLSSDPMLQLFVNLALAAGREIMAVYATEFTAQAKSDASPVTEADQRAERAIVAGLQEVFPEIPIVAEEQAATGHLPHIGERFFLVDPLDGTREFISRNGEFTVNIALIENGAPISGVVFAPAISEVYLGSPAVSVHANCKPKQQLTDLVWKKTKVRPPPVEGVTAIASRSHRDVETDAFLKHQKVAELISAGSSLKFCRIAAGEADLYPRFGRTMEWDTAAGHAVLQAAGGSVTKPDGSAFTYGKSDEGFANPAFIARGKI
jgi:3'(2'), 5'-bisphosphate nucleotidase